MTLSRHRGRGPIAAVIAAAGALVLSACTGVTYAETPLPTPPVSASSSPAPPATPVTCNNPTQSYDPLPSIPSSGDITDASVRRILDRGHLVVGVSADTYPLRGPGPLHAPDQGLRHRHGQGGRQEPLRQRSKLQLRVITAADRIPLLQDREVDMVARNMTMNCARWTGHRLLRRVLPLGPEGARLQGTLSGKDAATRGSSRPQGQAGLRAHRHDLADKLQSVKRRRSPSRPNHTGCLVLLQQGKADAITGDDIVLAGLAAQDPYTVIIERHADHRRALRPRLQQGGRLPRPLRQPVLADLEADGGVEGDLQPVARRTARAGPGAACRRLWTGG